jgi:hypothetical protein
LRDKARYNSVSGSFKKRVTLAGLDFQRSLAVWSMAALIVISVVLAVWASFSRAGGAAGPDGPGPDGSANPTATPRATSTVPTDLTPTAVVSAEDALQPFFSPDGADTVLLVTSATSLTDAESDWIEDIRTQIGPADTLSYSAATVESLAQYLTIFVIDESSELDVTALVESAAAGATVHLIGDASAYAEQVLAGGAG